MSNTGKRILVVEDELSISQALVHKLKSSGYRVSTAHNGKEGLRLALSQKPDLILLDIIMPVMDGVSMMRKLRQDDWGKLARVVVLTNLASGERVEQMARQGIHDYLIKADYSLDQLMVEVDRRVHTTQTSDDGIKTQLNA